MGSCKIDDRFARSEFDQCESSSSELDALNSELAPGGASGDFKPIDANCDTTGSGPTADTTEDNRADLGVLLVHGIGQSRSGETLVRFGEPLVDWIDRWLGNAGGARVETVDAVVGVEAEDPAAHAHARIRVTAPAIDGEEAQTSEWLIAESWWAQSFATPSFSELANWFFKIVPGTLFLHFQRRRNRSHAAVRRAWNAKPVSWGRVLTTTGKSLTEWLWLWLAFLLSPVLLAVIGLILLLGALPVPRLRRVVASLQRGLALTLGDSYALMGREIEAAAIYGRVRRTLDWLSARAKNTAVVAHSQGAAIAYRVVSNDVSGQCRLLITFGAGIRKLGQIRKVKSTNQGWIGFLCLGVVVLSLTVQYSAKHLGLDRALLLMVLTPLALYGSTLLMGALVAVPLLVWELIRRRQVAVSESLSSFANLAAIMIGATSIILWLPGQNLGVTMGATGAFQLSWLWVALAYLQARIAIKPVATMELSPRGCAKPLGEKPLPALTRWIDLYSTSDPVPNGPIFDGCEPDPLEIQCESKAFTSIEVSNLASIIFDHTAYWKNSDGFVSSVAGALGRACGLKLDDVLPFDRERLILARHRRRWRVRWLRWARVFVALAAVAVWRFADTGIYADWLFDDFFDFMRAIPLIGGLVSSCLPDRPSESAVAKTITVALGAGIGFSFVRLVWAYWNKKDVDTLVSRGDYPKPDWLDHPAALFQFSWLLVLAIALVGIFEQRGIPYQAYLIGALCLYMVCGIVEWLEPLNGRFLEVWRTLLKRHQSLDEESDAILEAKVRRESRMWVGPAQRPDGNTVWNVGWTLSQERPNDQTNWYEKAVSPTLAGAYARGKSKVDTVLAIRLDGEIVPVEVVLNEMGDSGESSEDSKAGAGLAPVLGPA